MLVWQEHRGGLHIHQPSHLAHDLSHHGAWLKRPDHGIRRFQQRAQLAEFFQPIALETDERTRQVADLVETCGEHRRIFWDGLFRGRQRLVL